MEDQCSDDESDPDLKIPSQTHQQSPTLPIQFQQKAAPTSSLGCRPPPAGDQYSDDESDLDPETPSQKHQQPPTQLPAQASDPARKASSSRSFRPGNKNIQYCSQKYLFGLVEGGSLDKMCPNALDHGEGHHQINKPIFLNLIRQQLSNNMDIDCKPVGLHGARGALFAVRLTSHGYTLAAGCKMHHN